MYYSNIDVGNILKRQVIVNVGLLLKFKQYIENRSVFGSTLSFVVTNI